MNIVQSASEKRSASAAMYPLGKVLIPYDCTLYQQPGYLTWYWYQAGTRYRYAGGSVPRSMHH